MPWVTYGILPSRTHRELPVDARLSGWAKTFREVEDLHELGAERHLFLPERTVRLTFSEGRSYLLLPSQAREIPKASLTGLNLEPLPMLSCGPAWSLSAELYPWSARQLFGWTAGSLYLDLEQEHAAITREVRGLLGLRAWAAAREAVTAWLLHLVQARGREHGAGISAALTLYAQKGGTRIAAVAEGLSLSARQLERLFAHEVGLSAKTLARLIRFEEIYRRLDLNPDLSLAALAYDLGFADQAHLTREFRTFTRMTPRAFSEVVRLRRDPSARRTAAADSPFQNLRLP